MTDTSRLTLDEANAKVMECLDLAARASSQAHKTMLIHMAETWQRICDDLEKTQCN